MDLNHLHLKVSSVDRAQRFYEQYFGLRQSARHGVILFLRDEAGMDFALGPTAEAITPPAWFHFGFRLGTVAAVEALHQTLEGAEVAITEPLTREDDHVWFRCADPDGYAIEVYW